MHGHLRHNKRFSEQPLYKSVKQIIRQKIIDREWLPGDCLPSEQLLGTQLNASQGTVRKALIELETDNIIIRRQGKGTYVAQHTDERALFRFFQLYDNAGNRGKPQSRIVSCSTRKPLKWHVNLLKLDTGEMVFIVKRVRYLNNNPVIAEHIVVSATRFAHMKRHADNLPNTLYQFYEETYGISIARAHEQITAVTAGKTEAQLLAVKPHIPLLRIQRIAYDLNDTAVELRTSLCLTRHHHYASDLE